jgi:hypothetical protein
MEKATFCAGQAGQIIESSIRDPQLLWGWSGAFKTELGLLKQLCCCDGQLQQA